MKLTKFYDSHGRLTAYALACGYVEKVESAGRSLTLWREHSTYHVRAHEFGVGRIFWESFRTLTEARVRFRKEKAEMESV